jgi:hypothetical protein
MRRRTIAAVLGVPLAVVAYLRTRPHVLWPPEVVNEAARTDDPAMVDAPELAHPPKIDHGPDAG